MVLTSRFSLSPISYAVYLLIANIAITIRQIAPCHIIRISFLLIHDLFTSTKTVGLYRGLFGQVDDK
jgi:hypothetical protein